MSTQGSRRLAITVPEAAVKLGIGKNQAYSAAKNGQLPTIKIGKRLLVPVAALEKKLASAGGKAA